MKKCFVQLKASPIWLICMYEVARVVARLRHLIVSLLYSHIQLTAKCSEHQLIFLSVHLLDFSFFQTKKGLLIFCDKQIQ